MAVIMNHLLLDDRILWADGSITVPSDIIEKYIHIADDGKLFTDEITNEISDYNKFVPPKSKIKIKQLLYSKDTTWNIPSEITKIDIKHRVEQSLLDEIAESDFTKVEISDRWDRLEYEWSKFVDNDLLELIYAIIYVINSFISNNIVWGVGRGSSTSSYLLYLLKVHDVDSVEYELDFSEFLP